MKHLDELNFLIDSASAIAGSDNKLAKALGVSRGNVSDWRKGVRPCPTEHQVIMASMAGFDPQATAARALVQKHEGTALGDKLMRVLGKPMRLTGAALGSVGAGTLAIYSMLNDLSNTMLIRATKVMSSRRRPSLGKRKAP